MFFPKYKVLILCFLMFATHLLGVLRRGREDAAYRAHYLQIKGYFTRYCEEVIQALPQCENPNDESCRKIHGEVRKFVKIIAGSTSNNYSKSSYFNEFDCLKYKLPKHQAYEFLQNEILNKQFLEKYFALLLKNPDQYISLKDFLQPRLIKKVEYYKKLDEECRRKKETKKEERRRKEETEKKEKVKEIRKRLSTVNIDDQ